MTYPQLVLFTQGERKTNYYEQLITNKSEIFDAILDSPKRQIAEDLNMSVSAFSTFYQCILALKRMEEAKDA